LQTFLDRAADEEQPEKVYDVNGIGFVEEGDVLGITMYPKDRLM